MAEDRNYTVHRLDWRVHEGQWFRLPGSTPVRTFPDPEAAASLARDQEWDYRRALNPFRCGGPRLHYQTHFDAPRLYDWVLDHGLDPPGITDESGVWAAWWDAVAHHLTPHQLAAVWEVLDRVRFTAVRRAPPERKLHLVGFAAFEDDPVAAASGDSLAYVGTRPYMVAGRKATADSLCEELYRTSRARRGYHVDVAAMAGGWERSGGRRPSPAWDRDYQAGHPTEYVERLPCAYFGPAPWSGQTLYAVIRLHWKLDPAGEAWRFHPPVTDSCGVPVAVYETLAAADAAQADLESAAREDVPSPFRFGSVLEWSTLHASAVWGVLSGLAPIDFTGLWSDYWAADRTWSQWWDRTVPGLTPGQVETAWSLFDKLRFYEVVAVEYRE